MRRQTDHIASFYWYIDATKVRLQNFIIIFHFCLAAFCKISAHESVPNHYSTNTSAASLMKLCASTAKQEKRRVAVTAQICILSLVIGGIFCIEFLCKGRWV